MVRIEVQRTEVAHQGAALTVPVTPRKGRAAAARSNLTGARALFAKRMVRQECPSSSLWRLASARGFRGTPDSIVCMLRESAGRE